MLGVIDWSKPASELDAQIRACDFGRYPNAFGLAKLVHRGRAVAVLEAECRTVLGAPPAGCVTSLDAGGILVATGQSGLRLTRFSGLNGVLMDAAEVCRFLGLRMGDKLAMAADAVDAAQLPAVSQALSRAEGRMLSQLAERRVPQLPVEQRTTAGPAHQAAVPLAPEFVERHGDRLHDACVAAFCAMLSNLLRDDNFDLALARGPAYAPGSLQAAVCSPALLWRVQVPSGANFGAWMETVAGQREALATSPGFLIDLVARQPALRDQPDLQRGELSTIAIVPPGAAQPPGAALCLILQPGGAILASLGLLDEATVRSLAERVAIVMRRAVAQPEAAIASIDALSDAERERQLVQWNATSRPFASALRIHDLFEQQVQQRPDDVALRFEGASLGFAELDRAANRLARVLQQRGCGVGQYVALVVERGLDLVVAMLGVAKAGAAYVPIDTIYPDDRLRFMVEDAGCVAIVASTSLLARCPEGVPLVCIDGTEVLQASDSRLPCPAQARDVCYAIYTSGSTGKPKGVVLTHEAVVNTLDWVNREFAVGPGDLLLFVTSPSFDLSVYDVFGALGAGATVEVASTGLLADPQALARRLCGPGESGPGITIWNSAPPALARLAGEFPPRAESSQLRLVMLSGDWIPLSLPTQLMSSFPGVQVQSLGGATEAAIWSNHFPVARVEPRWTSIPYGRPIQNARYDILDQHLRPLPAGIAGDLYIGGTCLAQGYLNRPQLSAERFIADPHRPGQRLYKTGDLARFWADGTMEFLGRADFQVKIRGYRVELGEIEAALCRLPGIQAALCTAFEDASGQKSLLAYVQVNDPRAFDAAQVKVLLASGLPAFMVPSHWVPLRSFPLSSNGKIDRRALPSPSQAARSQALTPASTDLQRRLIRVWESVLERSPIGITDNFFELGGHSLLAVVLAREMQQALGRPVPLSHIVSYPTIGQLSKQCAAAPAPAPAGSLPTNSEDVVELCATGQRPLFIVCHGQGHAWPYVELAQRLGTMFHTYAVMPRALPGIELAHDSIEDMARHCVQAMRSVQPEGPYQLAGLCAGGLVGFEMAVQLERVGQRADLIMLDAFVPRIAMRPEATLAGRRRARMARTIRGDSAADLGRRMRRAAGKAWRALRCDARRLVNGISLGVRLTLLARVLAGDRRWPHWIKPLGLYEIFIEARDRYWPQVLTQSRVILIKATQAQSPDERDEPVGNMYVAEDLGWSPYVARGLTIATVPSGHLSMLDAPAVDLLADCIKEFALFPPAPAADPAGARRPARVRAAGDGAAVPAAEGALARP